METKLKVTGMTCPHCVAAVKKALQQIPGVETTDVDLDKGEARVTGSAAAADLVAAIEEEGYGAEAR